MSVYTITFNKALNPCSSVSPDEAKLLFKEHLWKAIALQVLSVNCTMFTESQTAAQQAGLVFIEAGVFSGQIQGFGKGEWKHRPLSNQNQGKNHLSLQNSFGSGSGYTLMALG